MESFSGMESMFGTKTSQFLTRTTAVLGAIFLLTSISLAVLSARQTRSLIKEEAISTGQREITTEQKEAKESRGLVESKMPSAQEATTEENLPE